MLPRGGVALVEATTAQRPITRPPMCCVATMSPCAATYRHRHHATVDARTQRRKGSLRRSRVAPGGSAAARAVSKRRQSGCRERLFGGGQ